MQPPHKNGSSDDERGGQLVDELARAIGLRISEGTIPAGTWLRQRTLADEYGVSRTPVREALQKLEANQIVDLVPRRGAVVIGPNARQLKEM
jgi:DNA-binding GntR family transcriptional regulator